MGRLYRYHEPLYARIIFMSVSPVAFQTGIGLSPAHFGEWLQGPFRKGKQGKRSKIGLVTVLCRQFSSRAEFTPNDSSEIITNPLGKNKSTKAAKIALRELGEPKSGGLLTLRNTFPPNSDGWGMGSSSADCLATAEAVADSLGRHFEPLQRARIAFEAEGATDSIAFGNRALIWASREGEVIEDLGKDLPRAEIVGFSMSPHGHETAGVKFKFDYTDISHFEEIVAKFRRAVETDDIELLAEASTESAHFNQRFVKAREDLEEYFEFLRAGQTFIGALGIIVAHTGTVAGYVLDPGKKNKDTSEIERLLRAHFLNNELRLEIKQFVRFKSWE